MFTSETIRKLKKNRNHDQRLNFLMKDPCRHSVTVTNTNDCKSDFF